jgi:hypothetical protein
LGGGGGGGGGGAPPPVPGGVGSPVFFEGAPFFLRVPVLKCAPNKNVLKLI